MAQGRPPDGGAALLRVWRSAYSALVMILSACR